MPPPSPALDMSDAFQHPAADDQPGARSITSILPSEVLVDIFAECLPPDRFVVPRASHAPLLLCQIDSAWRKICLSTPKLWASIAINASHVYTDWRVDHMTELARLWLSRARSCPLSISLTGDQYLPEPIRVLLNETAPRWQHLKINLEGEPALLFDAVQAPLLETFQLLTPCRLQQDMPTIKAISAILFTSPRLREFGWNNSEWLLGSLDMPWVQLTHLTLNAYMSLEDCSRILEQGVNLTHVAFQYVSNPRVPSRRTIVLPRLLSFGISSDLDVGLLLDQLTLPSLREFVLNSRTLSATEWPHASFLSFLERSACSLESSAFYFVPFTESQFVECLEKIQGTLKALTVQMSDGRTLLNDDVLDLLVNREGRLCLCPRLEFLAVYNCLSCTPGRLADLVRSRLRESTLPQTDPLYVETLKVVETYENDPELADLRELQSQGLILKLYAEETGKLLELSPEVKKRISQLCRNGLSLQIYSLATGQFWEIDE